VGLLYSFGYHLDLIDHYISSLFFEKERGYSKRKILSMILKENMQLESGRHAENVVRLLKTILSRGAHSDHQNKNQISDL